MIYKEIKARISDDKILYKHQKRHTKRLTKILLKNNSAIDGSDTGTGKTYTALAIAKYLNVVPVVITTKSVVPVWERIAELFNIKIIVSNYENYQRGNIEQLKRLDIVQKIEDPDTKEITEIKSIEFIWKTNENNIIIFDEGHKCKNYKTLNTKILLATMKTKSKALIMSATIADNPLHMYSSGFVLGLFSTYDGFWEWAFSRGVYKSRYSFDFHDTKENLDLLHKDIYPKKGARISIKKLGVKFPSNIIITEPYFMENEKKINEVYYQMKREIKRLKKRKKRDKRGSKLTEILRARQEIEILKVPTIVELTLNAIEENNSVVIFVNYKDTIKALSKKLKTKCIIDGSITGKQRQINIDNFQADKERIIICNIKAGGVGISLHDLHGNHPRVSLICPDYSAQEIIQTLGRTPRAGAKSPAVQKFVFCKNTIEEKIAEKLQNKINNIYQINDGDLADEIILLD